MRASAQKQGAAAATAASAAASAPSRWRDLDAHLGLEEELQALQTRCAKEVLVKRTSWCECRLGHSRETCSHGCAP